MPKAPESAVAATAAASAAAAATKTNNLIMQNETHMCEFMR